MIKGDKREGVFSLSSGKLYTKVKKFLTPDSKFEVHTPTAVAAARGTAWISVVESSGSTFYSLKGLIIVFNPEFPTQIVTVNEGQFTVVATTGALPTVPAAFSIPMIEEIFNELGMVIEGAADAVPTSAEAGVAGADAGATGLSEPERPEGSPFKP